MKHTAGKTLTLFAERLMRQQEHVEQDVLAIYRPIFRKEADRTRGEIFPTVWYTSNIEVTSNQQALMAKSVLLAENPAIKYVIACGRDHALY